MILDLNERTHQILKLVIDAYVETGQPVGSMAVAQKLGMTLSPATIRNAMVELETLGLLYSPHTSAGRLPTESGLEVFVEGLLEVAAPPPTADRRRIERGIEDMRGQSMTEVLEQAIGLLSGLASCAGLVFAPKSESRIRQIEFVLLAPGRVLAVLVSTSGSVENRVLEVDKDVTATSLQRAANYLNAHIADKTLSQASLQIKLEMQSDQMQLDALSAKVAEKGIASFASKDSGGHLFIRGQANLLEDVSAIEDLERIRTLMGALEAKEALLDLLQATVQGDGVKIFIGADNRLFNHSGCAMIISPYKNSESEIVGAIGVIGPSRLNYGRIISVVNYTSQMIGKVLD